MNLDFLSNLPFEQLYALAFDAISSFATAAAVMVALWIAVRDKQYRQRERSELEARAATIVSLTLSGFADVLSKAIDHLKKNEGLTIDAPRSNVLHCVENCQSIIDRESFFHQVPTAQLGSAEVVVSLAKKWMSEIDFRRKIQKDPDLQLIFNMRNIEGIESLGSLLIKEATALRKACMLTRDSFERKNR